MACSSFLSSFSLTEFIKFFLIQKSKSSTNLNPKEEKQKQLSIRVLRFPIRGKKNISGVIYPRDNFPGGSCRILRSDTASQITPFSRECFFTPLCRTIKNSGRTGSGREDRPEKIITK